jgi:hypothetical protein
LRAVERVISDQSRTNRETINRLWEILDDPHLNKALGRKPLCAQRRALIRCLRKLGTISDLLDEQGRSELMRFSISRSCFSAATSTRKLRNTGGNISPMMLNPNGQRGRGGH